MFSLNLNDQVRETRALLDLSLDKRVILKDDLARALWRIHADPLDIDSILLNLTHNARDALPDGGEIKLATKNVCVDTTDHPQAPKAGDYVCLAVSDTGVGIAHGVRDKISDPFSPPRNREPGWACSACTTR